VRQRQHGKGRASARRTDRGAQLCPDGKGYPRGAVASDISLETRIITTADIFDAVTAARPYRDAIPVPRALEMMAESVGTALDPDCFAALRRVVDQLDRSSKRPLASVPPPGSTSHAA